MLLCHLQRSEPLDHYGPDRSKNFTRGCPTTEAAGGEYTYGKALDVRQTSLANSVGSPTAGYDALTPT